MGGSVGPLAFGTESATFLRALAMSTNTTRPSSNFPFMSIKAFRASSSTAKVTYPKPFDLFFTLSIIILAPSTWPNFENASASLPSVVSKAIPLTKSVEASPRWKIRRAGEAMGLGDDRSLTNPLEILPAAAMEGERERGVTELF